MVVVVIDAQGGGIGRQLVSAIARDLPDVELVAVGTNDSATTAMRKAGARQVATGENAVVVACRRADVIVGPIGIAIADSMLGEVTPRMALAVAQSDVPRILVPCHSQCDNVIVGVDGVTTSAMIAEALERLRELCR